MTDRRYAHEFYPHAAESETRPLAVEVPYLYARAIGMEPDVDWKSADPYLAGYRFTILIHARREALLADALLQGLTGDAAWEWADRHYHDHAGAVVRARALHYGVPVDEIQPYRLPGRAPQEGE